MGPKGTSIHLGVGKLGATFGAAPVIPAAPGDAMAMHALVRDAFGERVRSEPTVLCNEQATIAAVRDAFDRARRCLVAGDLFVLTFAGHGGQFWELVAPPDHFPAGTHNRITDEPDGRDEAWYLWNDVLLDDEIYEHLAGFEPGVRIFAIADTCHAATGLRDGDAPAWSADGLRGQLEERRAEARRHAPLVTDDAPAPGHARRSPDASILFLPACAAHAFVEDKACLGRGDLTAAILAVWAGGTFVGDHLAFHAAVKALCGPGQVPPLEALGPEKDLDAFAAQRPFTL